MTFELKHFFPAIFVLLALLFSAVLTSAERTFSEPVEPDHYETFNFFKGAGTAQTATSTTATSTNMSGGGGFLVIKGAEHVVLTFKRGDTSGQANTGNTNFRVQVTNNPNPVEADWQYYNTLITNTATTTDFGPALLSSVTITAATSTVQAYMPYLGYYAVRCIVVETTDGEHSCNAAADF